MIKLECSLNSKIIKNNIRARNVPLYLLSLEIWIDVLFASAGIEKG
jgi:hypothetical protein